MPGSSIGTDWSQWIAPPLLMAVFLQPGLLSLCIQTWRLWWRRSLMRAVCRSFQNVIFARDSSIVAGASASTARPVRFCRLPGVYADCTAAAALALMISTVLILPASLLATGLLLGSTLLLAGMIDLRWYWLPDRITLPMAAIGLLVAAVDGNGLNALIGLASGAGLFLVVRVAYKMLRGREGLGMGDVKLAAAMGAWLLPAGLFYAIFIAALTGCVVVLTRTLFSRPQITAATRIAFGPLLIVGFWVEWLTYHS